MRLAICPDASAVNNPYNYYMINVTETAAEKITELLTEENRVGAGLRVFVQGRRVFGFPVRTDDRRG
jgi:hypothetical protein